MTINRTGPTHLIRRLWLASRRAATSWQWLRQSKFVNTRGGPLSWDHVIGFVCGCFLFYLVAARALPFLVHPHKLLISPSMDPHVGMSLLYPNLNCRSAVG